MSIAKTLQFLGVYGSQNACLVGFERCTRPLCRRPCPDQTKSCNCPHMSFQRGKLSGSAIRERMFNGRWRIPETCTTRGH